MYKYFRTQENQSSMFYETFTGEPTEPSIDTILSYMLQSVTSMTLHTGRGAVPYQSEIPYIWLKNCRRPLKVASWCQNFDQSSQKVLGWVDF